jgi:hypothetical protein
MGVTDNLTPPDVPSNPLESEDFLAVTVSNPLRL